ncbi:MAG: cysteine--tRNA ligase [Corynebacteriales bacterium]|nr:cysteine--tRNA ligase [Mycobacteriales bacterium]
MTFRLYDTATRSIRDFTPKVAGQAGIYLCGATVQSEPHLGHMRSGVSYDILRRWLSHLGNEVTFIRNVTDIDDKILQKAPEQGRQWWALSYENERAFDQGYLTLGCLAPTYEPRATGHVPEMIELMHTLIATGHAYPTGGDVFFDVHSFPEYGALSNQKLENMRAAEDAEISLKRDPRDFALWKGVKPHEPASASWATPWGPGRPGWHLECSAMAGKYLGDEFDIHGGGPDLIFPHHENEIAQSKAAGRPFARYWVHHALVSLGGEKMSKSVGNTITLPVIFSKHRPIEVRYYLASPHYRSIIEYSEEALAEAAQGFGRIENFIRRATERVESQATVLPDEFTAAMNDDLATPRAFGVIHDLVRHGNQALADNDDAATLEALGQMRAMLGVLGLDPLDEKWGSAPNDELKGVVDALVGVVMEQRQNARARKDYAAADAIRDQLKSAGLAIEDTPQGPRWNVS